MPNTLHALDTLLARLLRTETIIAVIVILTHTLDGFSGDAEAIGGSAVAVAVAIGRSIVKASGYRDRPGRATANIPSDNRNGADRPAA
jgi:hypothetical protein